MPRGIFWSGTGKARSIAAKSSLVIFQPTPPLFSLTRSGWLAFGIVKIPGWRIRKLSTTCLEVWLYRSAIRASTRPPALCGDGKLPCPNGAYPTTAIPLWVQYGSRRRSIPRSPRWYNTWSHFIRSFECPCSVELILFRFGSMSKVIQLGLFFLFNSYLLNKIITIRTRPNLSQVNDKKIVEEMKSYW